MLKLKFASIFALFLFPGAVAADPVAPNPADPNATTEDICEAWDRGGSELRDCIEDQEDELYAQTGQQETLYATDTVGVLAPIYDESEQFISDALYLGGGSGSGSGN